MDVTEAIKKLNEYAKCGLTYNGRDIKLVDKYTDIILSHIAKEPTTSSDQNISGFKRFDDKFKNGEPKPFL